MLCVGVVDCSFYRRYIIITALELHSVFYTIFCQNNNNSLRTHALVFFRNRSDIFYIRHPDGTPDQFKPRTSRRIFQYRIKIVVEETRRFRHTIRNFFSIGLFEFRDKHINDVSYALDRPSAKFVLFRFIGDRRISVAPRKEHIRQYISDVVSDRSVKGEFGIKDK